VYHGPRHRRYLHDVSHVGDLWSEHDELAAVLAGASLETNVLSADEYGVWVSQCVLFAMPRELLWERLP